MRRELSVLHCTTAQTQCVIASSERARARVHGECTVKSAEGFSLQRGDGGLCIVHGGCTRAYSLGAREMARACVRATPWRSTARPHASAQSGVIPKPGLSFLVNQQEYIVTRSRAAVLFWRA